MLFHVLAVHSFLFSSVCSYMNIPHLCVHSPDAHLGCLQCWDITNKAAVSIYEQLFLWMWTFTSLGQGPRISVTSSHDNFKETSELFSTMVGPFHIPPAVCESSSSSTSWPTPHVLRLLEFRHSSAVIIIRISSVTMLRIFYVLIYHPHIIFSQTCAQTSCPRLLGCLFTYYWI